MSFLLNTLYLSLLLFVSPWVLWRAWRHGRYRTGWRDKLFGPQARPTFKNQVVWLHAVSVGEVQVLRTLVEMLESQRPDLDLAISVTTDSGMQLARKLYSKHYVFFTPFDFSWAMRRAIRCLKPDLIVLAELEIWPNWLLTAEKAGCPVAVMNGRLSERSVRGYARIPLLIRPCMKTIDWVGAQSKTYADRFQKLGVPSQNVVITGNTKFDGAMGNRLDQNVIERKQQLLITDSNLVWVAGSTQAPEEELVLKTFQKLKEQFPGLKLILVPRHAERFEEVAKQIEITGLSWAKRSANPGQVTMPDWDIFLGDTVGELRWWWGLADIGFVGGSFGDRGGQNMIEPCAYGVATCFGPNTKNFSDIVRLLKEHQACTQLETPEELYPWVKSMLQDSGSRKALATSAIELCKMHRGATQRTWQDLQKFLPKAQSVSQR